MKVLLCGDKSECEKVYNLLTALPFKVSGVNIVDSFDDIHPYLVDYLPNIAIVCESGAKGMETVFRIKESSNIPVVWFSDDEGFAVQSYRLGCTYFGSAPITAETLEKALASV